MTKARFRACTLPLEGMRTALQLAAEDGEKVAAIVAYVPISARGERPAELDGIQIRYEVPPVREAGRVEFHLEVKP